MKKVAVIGAGYTGLSSAKKLIENGFDVTIYEKSNEVRWYGKMHKIQQYKNRKTL